MFILQMRDIKCFVMNVAQFPSLSNAMKLEDQTKNKD